MSSERYDWRFTAPDMGRLLAGSARLRSFMAMLARSPDRYTRPGAFEAFERLCDEVRLDLRVCPGLPRGGVEPRNEAEALRFMEHDRYCRTGQFGRVQALVDRSRMDRRLLETVDRSVRDARRLGVPLFAAHSATALEVHMGHAVERFLPWACWDLIGDLVVHAGEATGYRVVAAETVPGHFRLSEEAPEYAGDERMRPERADVDDPVVGRDALLRYYRGGSDA